MFRKFKRFITKIKNIVRWIPILWNDRDYDYNFLLRIMNKKLLHMEQFFFSDGTFTLNAKKTGKQIKVARILLDRIILDDYSYKYPKDQSRMRENYKHQDYLKQQDMDYLTDLMSKKIFRWWD